MYKEPENESIPIIIYAQFILYDWYKVNYKYHEILIKNGICSKHSFLSPMLLLYMSFKTLKKNWLLKNASIRFIWITLISRQRGVVSLRSLRKLYNTFKFWRNNFLKSKFEYIYKCERKHNTIFLFFQTAVKLPKQR